MNTKALLSINMFVMIRVFSISQEAEIINGTYGIYYKIQQIALFSCFGLSNTIISLLAFNIGLGNKERIKACIKWGIIDTIIVAGIISILFEILANPVAHLFGLTASGDNKNQIITLCQSSIRIASIGYVFMGISLAIQGILQAYRKSITPLLISLLRLLIIVTPIGLLFINLNNAKDVIWWIFPITEAITAALSLCILKFTKEIKNYKK